jgi:hypothetical protein
MSSIWRESLPLSIYGAQCTKREKIQEKNASRWRSLTTGGKKSILFVKTILTEFPKFYNVHPPWSPLDHSLRLSLMFLDGAYGKNCTKKVIRDKDWEVFLP